MRNLFCLLLLTTGFSVFAHPGKNKWREHTESPDYLHRTIKQVTDVIVHDIYSPPVASRTYAYITVAAYEACRYANKNYVSLAGQLHNLKTFPVPDSDKEYSYSLAAVNAILLVAKTMVISEEKIIEFHTKLLEEFKKSGMPAGVFENSQAFGKKIADHVLAWAALDNYKQTRSLPRYEVTDDIGSWKPTAPAYMKAIEPYWNRIRTFVVDSAQQFKPFPATEFSTEKNSRFYKEAWEVYNTGIHLTSEQIEIANFWDCNPFKMNVNGHVMYATKKISPGGHWININSVICKKLNADLVRSAQAYACLSVVLADAFISCWDEKYRSRVIRPETYISQHINQDWMPLLQTPPFPEYTSGHSVISAAASIMLGKLFGANIPYNDSTEVEFGIPMRKFKSFRHAAEEAAISRLYGGIHYRPSIENGMEEGRKIGEFIADRLKTKP